MNRVISIAIALLLLAGCAPRIYTTKMATKIDPNKVVRIIPTDNKNTWYPGILDYKQIIFGSEPEKWTNVSNSFTGWASRMELAPGDYLIRFRCAAGNSLAYPIAPLKAEAGKTYISSCFNAENGLVGAKFVEVPSTP